MHIANLFKLHPASHAKIAIKILQNVHVLFANLYSLLLICIHQKIGSLIREGIRNNGIELET